MLEEILTQCNFQWPIDEKALVDGLDEWVEDSSLAKQVNEREQQDEKEDEKGGHEKAGDAREAEEGDQGRVMFFLRGYTPLHPLTPHQLGNSAPRNSKGDRKLDLKWPLVRVNSLRWVWGQGVPDPPPNPAPREGYIAMSRRRDHLDTSEAEDDGNPRNR